jgi:uncharacterized protein YcfL
MYPMLVLLAAIAGCAHRPPPAPEKPQIAYGCPVGTKQVHSMGDLIAYKVESAGEVKDISVPELQCSMQGDVLRIDFTLANSGAYVRRIAYRFDWIDRDGRKAWNDESWKPVYLYEHSRQTVMSTAPASGAVDFRLVLLDADKKR